MPNLIVSTVGTSLLTNQARVLGTDSKDLSNSSNKKKEEYTDQQLEAVELCRKAAENQLSGDVKNITDASAELNGIYGIYDGDIPANARRDIHWLITTDTYQGEVTAGLVKGHLNHHGILSVEIKAPVGLSTESTENFSNGIRDLLHWFASQNIDEIRNGGYKVIFNLVGGFKSLQGYLNTIAMFYADEIVYIFEGQGLPLIKIPRLPIMIDDSSLRQYAVKVAMMKQGLFPPRADLGDMPDALLEVDQYGDAVLSGWGILIWDKIKRSVLGENLLEFPFISYEERFRNDFRDWGNHPEKIEIQETLAMVSCLLQEGNGGTVALVRDGRPDYSPLHGHQGIYHFRVNWETRISCTVLPQGRGLLLRRIGNHDLMETHP